MSCHVLDAGAAPTLGPNLHGIVGRAIASQGNWTYSPAMQEHAGLADNWTYEQLNGYLERPASYLPGNAMSFVGLLDDTQRANAIAYLASITPSAPAFPEPAPPPEAAREGEAAGDAEGEVTGGGL